MFWIGLYLDGSVVKWTKITHQKKKISIDLLRTFPFSEEESFSFPQSAIEECPYKLISGLDSYEVLLRNVNLKIQDRKKISKLLPFQIEPQIPFPSEDAIASVQIYSGETPKSSKISFYAAKKNALSDHIDFLKQKKADPDDVSCVPAALWRFALHFFPELSDTLILHVGSKTTTLLGIVDKKPSFSHSFSLGSEPFSLCETEDLSSLNLMNLTDSESALYKLTEQAKKELDRVFTFFLKKQKDPFQNILLTGNFSAFPPLKSFIIQHLPEGLEFHECLGGESYDATTLESYAIPVGLALDGLAEDQFSTSFRKESFASGSQKKQHIKQLLSFALASLTLLSTTLLISNMYQDHHRKTLIEAFQSSFPLQTKIDTLEDLEREVSLLETSLKKEKIPYPLTLSIPNVSEVLAWLSSHPVLNDKTSLEELGEVDLKKAKYNLLKHPKIKAARLPYVGKVELEIEIPNRQMAKNFHESLQKENSFTDAKKEVSFQSKGSTYLVSFFLKPNVGGNRP